MKIEIEVDTLDHSKKCSTLRVDAVLLDNMTPDCWPGRGDGRRQDDHRGIGPRRRESVPAIAATGVDYISSGWITHSAPILDLGLDIVD